MYPENLRTFILERMNQVNEIANSFMQANRLAPLDYHFSDLFKAYTSAENIAVFEELPPIDAGYFLGVTVQSAKSTAIFLNPTTYPERKNFSICHELNHCLFDLTATNTEAVFFTTQDSAARVEQLADIGASVLLIPDIAIVELLHTRLSFDSMAAHFGSSKSAFYQRLFAFACYRMQLKPNHAQELIRRLQITGERAGILRLLSGWGAQTEKRIRLAYQTAEPQFPLPKKTTED